jgi:hypothetical protein
MKNRLLIITLLALSLGSNLVLAAPLSEVTLNKLLALSGMTKQVAEIPTMVEMGVEQSRQQISTISDADFNGIKRSLADAFNPAEIISAIGAEVKVSTTEADAKDLFVWYESALARRITKAEEDASTPAAYQTMMQSAQSLLADKKRVQFARKLDELLKITDMTVQLQINAAAASFIAVSTAHEPNKAINIEQIKSQFAQQMKQERASIEQLLIVSMVYSYKDIALADLEKYGAFLKLPKTRRFNEASKKGLITAIDQSIKKMSQTLATLSKQQKAGI